MRICVEFAPTRLPLLIFTDDLALRALDLPDLCLLRHAKKRNLLATRAETCFVLTVLTSTLEPSKCSFCESCSWPAKRPALKALRSSQRRGEFLARAILASARKYAATVSGTVWL